MRNKMINLILVLALGVVICLPGVALADWTFLGATSYVDNYPENYPTAGDPITLIDAYITGGGISFSSTGMIDFNSEFSGWTPTLISSTFSQATNSSGDTAARWNYQFADPQQTSFALDWNAFDSTGEFVVHEHVTVAPGIISGVYDTYQYIPDPLDCPTPAVPLPPSVLLLGSGLLGLGFLPRRKQSEV
jgi:hypothetical protein